MAIAAAANQPPNRKRDASGELRNFSESTDTVDTKEVVTIQDSDSESRNPQIHELVAIDDSDQDSQTDDDDSDSQADDSDSDSQTDDDDDSDSQTDDSNSDPQTDDSGTESDESQSQMNEMRCGLKIYAYLREVEMEEHRRPLPDYIEKVQNDVTAKMRPILVDWLVEVVQEYDLLSTTFYLSVSYIDRFLSRISLPREKLQLLGVACLWIASKYEESALPRHIDQFCFITDNTYKAQELAAMESEVLTVLNHEMANPTGKTFLTKLIRIAAQEYEDDDDDDDDDEKEDDSDDDGSEDGDDYDDSKSQLEFLGDYLGELSLLEYDFVKFRPSLVAAAAVFLANFTYCPEYSPWSNELRCYSGYGAVDLKECVLILHELQLGTIGKAVRRKYNYDWFKCVSKLSPLPQIPSHYFLD